MTRNFNTQDPNDQSLNTLNTLKIKDKYILITGATGYIGRELALQTAAAGANLILLGRNNTSLTALDDEIHGRFSVKTLLWSLDLLHASQTNLKAGVDELSEHIPAIDIIFHCANHIGEQVPVLQEPHETWLKVMQVNVEAPRLLIKEVLPLLQAADKAQIFFFIDENNDALYQGAFKLSKQMLLHWTQELNLEFEKINNITAGVLKLPPIYSPLRAKRFPGEQPETNILPHIAVADLLNRLFQ